MSTLVRTCQVLLVFAVASAVAGEARAHGFKVGLVALFTGPEAARGRDIRDGFLLAARERDGHPDQHSDGHLGRMDVYILPVDGAGDTDAALAEVKALVDGEAVEFLLVVAGLELSAAIGEIPDDTIVVDLGRVVDLAKAGGDGLAASFEADYSRPLTPAAGLGYAVAWRIDRTIRAVEEDVSDREALRAAYDAAGS